MSLPKETMIELMQYADGELDAAARARVEALLQANEEARGVVEAIGTLGVVVREGASERIERSAAAYDVADGVMAAIAATTKETRVAPIGRPRRARSGATSAAIVVLALAAGVVFFFRSKAPAPVAKEEPLSPASAVSPREPESPSATAVAESEARGVDLEEVRSVQNKVNVFFTPTTPSAGASVVVWIDDRPGGP
jgi:anti-sigma factor RsiW